MYYIFFIRLSVSGYLGCIYVLAMVSSDVMNVVVCVSFLAMFFSGYMFRRGIAESYGNSVLVFLKNLHTVLSSDCTHLHSHHNF